MKEIAITEEYIKLGQLLKLAGIADSGAHAKILILNGHIKVNGKQELRRGRKLMKGDTIESAENEPMVIINRVSE